MSFTCDRKRCRQPATIIHKDLVANREIKLCDKHWDELCKTREYDDPLEEENEHAA
jgi:hypothetical protein